MRPDGQAARVDIDEFCRRVPGHGEVLGDVGRHDRDARDTRIGVGAFLADQIVSRVRVDGGGVHAGSVSIDRLARAAAVGIGADADRGIVEIAAGVGNRTRNGGQQGQREIRELRVSGGDVRLRGIVPCQAVSRLGGRRIPCAGVLVDVLAVESVGVGCQGVGRA